MHGHVAFHCQCVITNQRIMLLMWINRKHHANHTADRAGWCRQVGRDSIWKVWREAASPRLPPPDSLQNLLSNTKTAYPFHIHVSLHDMYCIFSGSVHIFSCSRIGRPLVWIHKSLTDTWMWNLGLRRRDFLFWEYFFRIFGIES
jgi:hypothetical protein